MNIKELIKTTKYSTVIGVFIFLIERSIATNGFKVGANELLTVFFVDFIYAFVLNILNFKYFSFLDQFISWKEQPRKRLVYGVIGAIIVTMIGITFLRYLVVIIFEHGSFQDFLNTGKSYYIFSFIITINILITVHAIFFFKEISKKKVKEHQVISKTETAKFESLKNQLDPHFLFNSLNVLTSLIQENPKQAEKFTTKLSKIYRYVLQQKSQDLIEVSSELQFAKNYMDLLKIRFEDAIDFTIADDFNDDKLKIVPLSLQLLLENAVKHNVISPQQKLKINISKKGNYMLIQNNINLKNSLGKSTKVGLKNIIDRYALITKSKVSITQTDQYFTVQLPLLLKKSTIMNISNQEEKYNRAKEKVKQLKEFYSSLIAFAFIIPMLYFIWRTYTPNVIPWFLFPFFGWGFSLIMQWFKLNSTTSKWEKRKIEEFMKDDIDSNQVKF